MHQASEVTGSVTESGNAETRTIETGNVETGNGFESLGLNHESLAAIQAIGYTTPSPIQRAFIPRALLGGDCTGQARTGTGKTAAFMLPIFERIDRSRPDTQAIVLTPTRELSEQVAHESRRLAGKRPFEVVSCVGGKQIRSQITAIKHGAQVIVGTPGRVLDLINRRVLLLDTISVAVLDEADRMLDIGFRPDIERILKRCPTDRQTLLLSATMPPPVERLAQRYMRNAQRVDLSQDRVDVATVHQFYVTVDHHRKFSSLIRLLVQTKPRQAIVFCRTKRGADNLYQRLAGKLSQVSVIHGDLQQSARDRAMRQFRDGSVRLLIATDVVGRGIDVTGVSHIINYDIPEFCDDYIHRIGRTGRLSSGDVGMAFTFVCRDEGPQLTSIEMRINRLLPQYCLETAEELARQRQAAAQTRPVENPASVNVRAPDDVAYSEVGAV